MKGLVSCLVVAWAAACSFAPKPPPAPPRTTRLGLQLEQFELANGLRVVLVHDQKAPEIQVTMRYRAGAVDDPEGQAGIAHLVEHLMFQQVLGSQSLYAHLEAGATYFNAFTSNDATTYITRATPAHLDELLSIEAVRVGLRCTSITDSTFEREREVVVNEIALRGQASAVHDALNSAAYPAGHPYHASIGGSAASVSGLTRAQACAFADAHYAPSNAVLVISGDLGADQVQTSLKKFMTHVARRTATPQVDVPALRDVAGERTTVEADISEDSLLVAWPLPDDPQTAIRVRALAETVAQGVDDRIKGKVQLTPLGDLRAPMLGLVVVPAKGESEADVLKAVEAAANNAGAEFEVRIGIVPFGRLALDRVQQTAIFDLFASLDDFEGRDTRLAAEVLAGRDPSASLAAEFRGLRELTSGTAQMIASEYLGLRHAHVTTLHAAKEKTGATLVIGAKVHDVGQRREPADPALATAPLVDPAAAPAVERMRTRTLPNGMRVVLLPLTSVPTVDARLVFAAGTGDDPPARRGVAMLAANLLGWDLRYLNDLLSFSSAGGRVSADVGLDHTAFSVHGLDMHLDFLLAGLRRVARDGHYDESRIVATLHDETKRDSDEGAFSDALHAALYGPGHPYVAAGVVRHVDPAITRIDLETFRKTHLVPANATLVIAGHFDADLADKWIDFLFADWSGGAVAPRSTQTADPKPATIARYTDTAQVALTIAIPLAPSADPEVTAQRLVVAEMLDALAADVRHQLGATYGLDARLFSARLAADYTLTGAVEAARTKDALELVDQRIRALRDDPAPAFVAARARVVTRLRSLAGGATTLAARAETDAGLARPPLSDLDIASRVAQLTLDQLGPALADLEPKRAVIALRGPEAAITPAVAMLDRTATTFAPPPDVENPLATTPRAARTSAEESLTAGDLEDAITGERAISHFAYSVAAGYTLGSVGDLDIQGATFVGELGYRFDETTTLGLHLQLGYASGADTIDTHPPMHYTHAFAPVELGLFARAETTRFWGTAFFALSALHESSDDPVVPVVDAWTTGITAGLEAGIDLVRVRSEWISLYGRVQGVLLTDTGFDVFTLGLAVRR